MTNARVFTKDGQGLRFEVTVVQNVPVYRVERVATGTSFRFNAEEWQEFMGLIQQVWTEVQEAQSSAQSSAQEQGK